MEGHRASGERRPRVDRKGYECHGSSRGALDALFGASNLARRSDREGDGVYEEKVGRNDERETESRVEKRRAES